MDLVDVQSMPYAIHKDHRFLLHHTLSYLQHNSFKTEDSWVWIGDTTKQGNFYTFNKQI
jgi:hypothetical protein